MRKSFIVAAVTLAALAGCSDTSKTVNPSTPVPSSVASSVATPTPVPSSDSGPAQTPTDLPLGQSITVTGTDNDSGQAFAMSVIANRNVKVNRGALDEITGPPQNGRYVGVQALYSCTQGKCGYNEYSWTLRSAAGDQYNSQSDYQPVLNSGDIPAGKNARGWLTFDVPPGKYTLEYQNNIADTDPASWVVTVK